MKIWISEKEKYNNNYALKYIAGLTGGVLLMAALILGATMISLKLGWSIRIASVVICIVGTILLVIMCTGIGRAASRDAVVFLQNEDRELYVIDVRKNVRSRKGLLGYFAMLSDIQKALEQIRNEFVLQNNVLSGSSLMAKGMRIMSVETMKELGNRISVVCNVSYPNGRTAKCTYLIDAAYEQRDELILALEHMLVFKETDMLDNRNGIKIFVSVLALIGVIAICYCSHPWVAVLPQAIYFPALGAAGVAIYFVIYFIIKNRRGE